MLCTRIRHGVLLVTLLTALGGCSKSDDSSAVATTSTTTTAPTSGQPPAMSSSPAKSAVVPATASQPIVQADPVVIFHTSVGDLAVRLYEKQAPRTVSNFLGYARSGFYNGTIFHQVEPGFVAMGGGMDVRKQPKSPRYPIANEATNGLKNVRGSLAMAHDPDDPQSATCQFFFNLADNSKLDHRGTTPAEFGYCVFGQVIEGLDVLDKMSSAATGPTVVIHTMRVGLMPRDDQVRPASNQSSSVQGSRSPRACKCDDCVVGLPDYATEVSLRIAALNASPPPPPNDNIQAQRFYIGMNR